MGLIRQLPNIQNSRYGPPGLRDREEPRSDERRRQICGKANARTRIITPTMTPTIVPAKAVGLRAVDRESDVSGDGATIAPVGEAWGLPEGAEVGPGGVDSANDEVGEGSSIQLVSPATTKNVGERTLMVELASNVRSVLNATA